MRTQIKVRRNDKQALLAKMKMIQGWNGKMSEDEKQVLSLFHWLSLDWLKRTANRDAMMNLVFVCNIALILANKGYPRNYMGENNEDFATVLTHLKQAIERGKKTGSWALNGELIMKMPAILALHDRQLAEVSRKVYESVNRYVGENA